jgi:hypothetical protein
MDQGEFKSRGLDNEVKAFKRSKAIDRYEYHTIKREGMGGTGINGTGTGIL